MSEVSRVRQRADRPSHGYDAAASETLAAERGETGPPRSRSWLTWSAVALAIVLTLYLLLEVLHTFGAPLLTFDEPIELVNSLNVLRGQTPHTDFVSTYPPLHYYLLAASFRLLGVSIVSARLVQCLFLLACTAALLLYMRRGGASSTRILFYTLLAVACGQYAVYPSYGPLALSFLGLLAYLASCASIGRRALVLLVASGLLTGLAFVGRINFGAYIAAAIWLEMLVALVLGWRAEGKTGARDHLIRAAAFTGAFVLSVAVYLLPYGADVPLVLHQIIGIPPKLVAGAMIDAPIGTLAAPRSLLSSRTVGVFILLGFPLVWTALRISPDDEAGQRRRWLLAAAILGVIVFELLLAQRSPTLIWIGLLPVVVVLVVAQLRFAPLEREEFATLLAFTFYLHYFLSRPDFDHLFYQSAIAMLLLPFLPRTSGARPLRDWRRTVAILALAAVGLRTFRIHLGHLRTDHGIADGVRILDDERALRTQGDARSVLAGTVPSPVIRIIDPDPDEISVARYVASNTAPSDPVYVGLSDHTRPYTNDLRLYWILDRPVGARHTLLMTGLITTPEAQAEVRQDLERRHVKWVVLWDGPPESEAHRIEPDRGPPRLDEYIRATYEPRARFGAFAVLARRATANTP